MLDWLASYGMFLAEVFTIVIGIIITFGAVIALSSKGNKQEQGSIKISHLNQTLDELRSRLQQSLLDKAELKKISKEKNKALKANKKSKQKNIDSSSQENKKRVFVIDYVGDIKASQTEFLAKKINGILSVASAGDEVVVRLESPGGVVHGYGLAASQLKRIPEQELSLTICVDKVAASGGYMMACVANKIIAAPFAIIGSVGVVAQVPNLNRLLKKHDIDYDIYTAGEYKRTVTMLGENTEEGKEKFKQDLHQTHELFKTMIAQHRPSLDINEIATGEIWYGQQAIDKGLIDEINTSDSYLMRQMKNAEVYHLEYQKKEKLSEKLGFGISNIIEQVAVQSTNKLRDLKFK